MSSPKNDNETIDIEAAIEVLMDPNAGLEWDEAWDYLKHVGVEHKHRAPMLKSVVRENHEGSQGEFAQLFALKALKKIEVPTDDIYSDILRLAKTAKEHLLRIESAKDLGASSAEYGTRVSDVCSVIKENTDKSISLRLSLFMVLARLVGGPFKAISALSEYSTRSKSLT